jgi:uncharacterized glyoxalase superfamily protein PhnB
MTDPAYKPSGYSDVSVYMMANGAQRVIDFCRAVFDAEPLRRLDREDGTIMHAEIRIGDTVVMMSDRTPAIPAFPVWLHVYVPDVDAAYERALGAGATPVQAPEKKEDEDRRGGVKDPTGNVWWMATMVG